MYAVKNECFGSRLQLLMQEHHFTMRSLAAAVHLSPSTIFRYIHGQITPKLTTIEILSQLFGVSPAWLMGYQVVRFSSSTCENDLSSIVEQYLSLSPSQKAKVRALLFSLSDAGASDEK